MNFKKIIADFGTWIYSLSTVVGFAIIYVGIGGRGRFKASEETNVYIVAFGIILIIPYLISVLKTKVMKDKVENMEHKRISDLINNGDKVMVALDSLEIKSNSYTQEIEVGSGLDARNEHIGINHNVILVNVSYNEELIENRLDIYMDTTKLKMHFAIKQETEWYVDPSNPNNNYLDLSFLES